MRCKKNCWGNQKEIEHALTKYILQYEKENGEIPISTAKEWLKQIWELSQKHKNFRMELDYDAEALNVEYRFYLPETDTGGEEYGERAKEW